MDERLDSNRREDIHTFVAATRSAFYQKNKPILKELLDKSIRAKHGDYALLDVQFELLGHILEAQAVYKKYAHWKVLIARAIKSLTKDKAPLERIKQAQSRLEYMQNSMLASQLLLGQLRSIGDGIAWWFLNYDRVMLRFLTEHEYVTVTELGRGLDAEIYECAKLASKDKLFLLNSITNFLRIADITVYDKKAASFELIEVKAGRLQTTRTIRQHTQLSIAQESIRKGEYAVISDGATANMVKIESPKPLLTYVKSLETAMLEAKQKSVSSRVFGEYLSLSVYYLENIVELSEQKQASIQKDTIDRVLSIKRKNDFVLHLSGNILHTVHFSRVLAPYVIFPIKPELRFALINGEFLLDSFVNIDGFGRWFRNRGWTLEVLKLPNEKPDFAQSPFLPIFRVHKPHSQIAIEIPVSIVCVAAMELWMPESIERTIQETLESGYTRNIVAVNFKNTGRYAWD